MYYSSILHLIAGSRHSYLFGNTIFVFLDEKLADLIDCTTYLRIDVNIFILNLVPS